MSANGRLVYCVNQQPIFLLRDRKFGPTFALIRDCFVKFRFSSVAVMKNQGNWALGDSLLGS